MKLTAELGVGVGSPWSLLQNLELEPATRGAGCKTWSWSRKPVEPAAKVGAGLTWNGSQLKTVGQGDDDVVRVCGASMRLRNPRVYELPVVGVSSPRVRD